MNYSEQPTGNGVHDSITATAGHHYFDVREMDDVGTQIRHQLDDIQATILSQMAVEFRTIHERLDTLENRLSEALNTPTARTPQARLSGLETKLQEILGGHTPRTPLHNNVSTSTNIHSTISQNPTPTSTAHLTSTHPRQVRTPLTSQMISSHTDLTPVSQLPSEESAKVKVLLRQFAAKAMNYIEKNAASYTNVNNNVGAITTMKKFDIYESSSWDQFVETNFPNVQKSDLKDELVKIVGVKVKNTKARFKKRLSESHHPHRHLQQPQLHSHQVQPHSDHMHQEQTQQQSPQLSDAMSDGIMTPPTKRLCSGIPLDIKNPNITHAQTPHQNSSLMTTPVSLSLQQCPETMIQNQTQY